MPASDDFVRGYTNALADFEAEEIDGKPPAFINPYAEGTDAHRGYEEAVYDLTQK